MDRNINFVEQFEHKTFRFRKGVASFYSPAIGVILFINPTYKIMTREMDVFYVLLYSLAVLYFILGVIFYLIRPLITFENGAFVNYKFIFFKYRIPIDKIIEIEWDASEVLIASKEAKIEIDTKKIHNIHRQDFTNLINEIAIFKNLRRPI